MKTVCNFCGTSKRKLSNFERVVVWKGLNAERVTKTVKACPPCQKKAGARYNRTEAELQERFANLHKRMLKLDAKRAKERAQREKTKPRAKGKRPRKKVKK